MSNFVLALLRHGYLTDLFQQSNFHTGNQNDIDPTWGYINYLGRDDAFAKGLVKYDGSEMYVGVDHETTKFTIGGRPSVRLESKKDYKKGLFIARFSHLPKSTCGAWPAL